MTMNYEPCQEKGAVRVKPNDTGCKWAVQKDALNLAYRREPASDKHEKLEEKCTVLKRFLDFKRKKILGESVTVLEEHLEDFCGRFINTARHTLGL